MLLFVVLTHNESFGTRREVTSSISSHVSKTLNPKQHSRCSTTQLWGQTVNQNVFYNITEAACDLLFSVESYYFPKAAAVQLSCTWTCHVSPRSAWMNLRAKKRLPFIRKHRHSYCVWKDPETERRRTVLSKTEEVCEQGGEGCPALRKTDHPSSQAYSCHSTLTHAHARTHARRESRLGSSATNYLNMVLKRPLERVQLEGTE